MAARPAADRALTRPARALLANLPERDLLPEDQIAPPLQDRAVASTRRPLQRPATEPAKAAAAAEPVARKLPVAANSRPSQSLSGGAARSMADARAAEAAWAAAIQRRIARHQSYPRGARTGGKVRISMVILPSGSLSEVRIARSSGVAALDRAAVRAARRAAPFPPAPKNLTSAWYSVGQWVNFER